jgi:glycosyltransferase involved in cell wall biosynthesis
LTDRPLISCIVPVYNGERYLAEALDSILAQTYGPLEILVVDDGSTDRTSEVVAGYGSAVRTLHQPNAGPAAARNRGIAAANGAFLAFLDADDCWHPAKLERQMTRFAARPELEASVTLAQNYWIPELQAEAERHRDRRYSQPVPGYVCQTLLARRALFEAIGEFDSLTYDREHPLGEDNDWFLRAREHGAVIELLPEVLLQRRLHLSNLSHHHRDELPDVLLDVVKKALDRRRATSSTPSRNRRPGSPGLEEPD